MFLCIGIDSHDAQSNLQIPKVTQTFFLKGATVIPSPGTMLENTSILIENGRIKAIGNAVHVPAYARVIVCDSMYIYPGFIEGISHTGIEAPRTPERGESTPAQGRPPAPEVRDPGNPPNAVAGITPEQRIRDILKPEDKSIADARKLGFTVSHVVPRGRMLPGMGSVVSLGEGAVDNLVIRENVSMFSQFAGAPQVFPSNVIAVMAKWRELYRQSLNASLHLQAFEHGAEIERPKYDRAVEAMIPVSGNSLPVFFKSTSSVDMSRAWALQKELGFKMVLAEVKQSWRWLDQIKSSGTPVLISLNLPEDKSEKKKADPARSRGSEGPVANASNHVESADLSQQDTSVGDTAEVVKKDPEKEALETRRKQSLEEHYRQAAVLAGAGIPFGFSTLDVKQTDILANLRKMIKHGLSEDQALAALTIHPARLLGIDRITGTIAQGKLANVVITTAPYFQDDAQVRYVFVEGVMYEYEIKSKREKKSADSSIVINLAGKWKYEVQIPGESPRTGTMVFRGSDGNYSGYFVSDDDGTSRDLQHIVLDGTLLTFSSVISADGQNLPLEFTLKLDGDSMDGEVNVGPFGTFSVDGSKIPD
jgi:hypothetical protein